MFRKSQLEGSPTYPHKSLSFFLSPPCFIYLFLFFCFFFSNSFDANRHEAKGNDGGMKKARKW